MKHSKTVFNQRLVKKGVFNLKQVISTVSAWAKENEYDFVENRNVTKEKDKGIEVNIEMICLRDVDEYFSRVIKLDFLVIKIKKVKLGASTLDKGEFEARLSSEVVLDRKNKYHSYFSEKLMEINEKYFINKQIDDHKEIVWKDAHELLSAMKKSLGLT
ncbi:MAG: hypothetical protein AABW49_04900 [Nanoarchaeota archaeon]